MVAIVSLLNELDERYGNIIKEESDEYMRSELMEHENKERYKNEKIGWNKGIEKFYLYKEELKERLKDFFLF